MWIDDRYYSDEEFFLRILKGKAEDLKKLTQDLLLFVFFLLPAEKSMMRL